MITYIRKKKYPNGVQEYEVPQPSNASVTTQGLTEAAKGASIGNKVGGVLKDVPVVGPFLQLIATGLGAAGGGISGLVNGADNLNTNRSIASTRSIANREAALDTLQNSGREVQTKNRLGMQANTGLVGSDMTPMYKSATGINNTPGGVPAEVEKDELILVRGEDGILRIWQDLSEMPTHEQGGVPVAPPEGAVIIPSDLREQALSLITNKDYAHLEDIVAQLPTQEEVDEMQSNDNKHPLYFAGTSALGAAAGAGGMGAVEGMGAGAAGAGMAGAAGGLGGMAGGMAGGMSGGPMGMIANKVSDLIPAILDLSAASAKKNEDATKMSSQYLQFNPLGIAPATPLTELTAAQQQQQLLAQQQQAASTDVSNPALAQAGVTAATGNLVKTALTFRTGVQSLNSPEDQLPQNDPEKEARIKQHRDRLAALERSRALFVNDGRARDDYDRQIAYVHQQLSKEGIPANQRGGGSVVTGKLATDPTITPGATTQSELVATAPVTSTSQMSDLEYARSPLNPLNQNMPTSPSAATRASVTTQPAITPPSNGTTPSGGDSSMAIDPVTGVTVGWTPDPGRNIVATGSGFSTREGTVPNTTQFLSVGKKPQPTIVPATATLPTTPASAPIPANNSDAFAGGDGGGGSSSSATTVTENARNWPPEDSILQVPGEGSTPLVTPAPAAGAVNNYIRMRQSTQPINTGGPGGGPTSIATDSDNMRNRQLPTPAEAEMIFGGGSGAGTPMATTIVTPEENTFRSRTTPVATTTPSSTQTTNVPTDTRRTATGYGLQDGLLGLGEMVPALYNLSKSQEQPYVQQSPALGLQQKQYADISDPARRQALLQQRLADEAVRASGAGGGSGEAIRRQASNATQQQRDQINAYEAGRLQAVENDNVNIANRERDTNWRTGLLDQAATRANEAARQNMEATGVGQIGQGFTQGREFAQQRERDRRLYGEDDRKTLMTEDRMAWDREMNPQAWLNFKKSNPQAAARMETGYSTPVQPSLVNTIEGLFANKRTKSGKTYITNKSTK